MASRRWGVLRVLVWSQGATLLLIWIAVGLGVLGGVLEPQLRTVLIGAAGGCAGVLGLAAFYRALAIGPMALVPPIAATGVLAPVVVGLAEGQEPTQRILVGIAIAVVGVVLAAMGESPIRDGQPKRIGLHALGLSLFAAAAFACIFVAMDAAAGSSATTAFVATAGVRSGGMLVILAAIVVLRERPWRGVPLTQGARFAGIGVLDTLGNLCFAVAAALGELEVAAVLGSLYPAVTSALAHGVLGERLGRLQLVGVACALAGIILLAGA